MAWPPTTHQDVQDEVSTLRNTAGSSAPITGGRPQIGEWIHSPGIGVNFKDRADGQAQFGEFFLPEGTYDAIGFYVQTGGSTGATARALIYSDGPDGRPQNLLVGTAAIDVTTNGMKTITGFTLAIPNGGQRVWTDVVPQGNPTTWAVFVAAGETATQYSRAALDPTFMYVSTWQVNGITGTPPATVTPTARSERTVRVGIRRSA